MTGTRDEPGRDGGPRGASLDPPRDEPRVIVALTDGPLDVVAAHRDVDDPTCGGIGLFLGVVRDHHEGDVVDHLEYEAWRERAVPELERVGHDVAERYPGVRAVHLSHRLGRLEVGEVSVIVAVSAPHRAEALEAARDAIDHLKRTVPIWKHEFLVDGGERWPGC